MSATDDPTAGAAGPGDDPTTQPGVLSGDDPTAGSAGAGEDPSQGGEMGSDPYEDPTEGGEVGESPGEDPTERTL